MALQVWLPLTKDTRQQGLSSISVTGSPAAWNNGKLGKCAYWNGAVANVLYNNTTDFNYTDNFSVAFWANPVYTGSTVQYAWTVGRADAGGYGYGFQIINATTAYFRFGNGSYSVSAPSNEWHHFVMTVGNSKVTIYKDGSQVSSNNLPGTIPTYSDGNGMGLGCFHYSGNIYPYYGSLNDFRIYDHCLSPMEVKELSKGLVLHYPLNRGGWGQENLLPNTNEGTIGWNWTMQVGDYTKVEETTLSGVRGCKFTRGTTAQSGWSVIYYSNINESLFKTSTKYKLSVDIYPSVNTNFVVSIRESNGTNVFASAAPAKAVIANKWNHLEYDLTTVATLPSSTGETIYFQSMNSSTGVSYIFKNLKLEEGEVATSWCPNSSDALATTMGLNGTTEYDTSGYCYNGTYSALPTVSSNTPKYNVSTFFGAYNTPNMITNDTTFLPALTNCTVAWWEYCTTTGNSLPFVGQSGSYYIGAGSSSTRLYDSNIGSSGITLYKDGVVQSTTQGTTVYHPNVFHTQNQWHHFVMTGVNLSTWTAFKINSYGSGWPVNAYLSDVRIYATVFSENDVKSLYQNSAYIDSSGNVYGAVHSEV